MKRKIDILLIPPVISPLHADDFKNFIPIGLIALKATLEERGFLSEIYLPRRTLRTSEDYKYMAGEILSYGARSLGFSTWSLNFPSLVILTAEIKKREQRIPIVLGGPQATISGRQILHSYLNFDYILKGESDYTLPDFLTVLFQEKQKSYDGIPGLVFRDATNMEIIENEAYGFVTNLDDLPIPKYEVLCPEDEPVLDIGRGCPYNCTFCTTSNFFSKKYRVKSVSRIISEMDYCYALTGKSYMGFLHDNLTLNRGFISSLCEGIANHNQKSGRNYTWHCSARTDCVTEALLSRMARGGCRSIFYGIESGSSRIQEIIKKRLKLNVSEGIVENTIAKGIKPIVSYIIGFPEETRSDVEETIQSVVRMHLLGAHVQVSLLSVLPGTPIFKTHKSKLKFDGIFSDFSKASPFQTEDTIIKSSKELFSAFYYLPNRSFSRKELVFLVNILNILPDFKITTRAIKEYICHDLMKYKILPLIETKQKDYSNQRLISRPDLEFFAYGLLDYLLHAIRNNAPRYICDLFLLENASAVARAKYTTMPIIDQIGTQNSDQKKREIIADDHYYVRPCWEVIKTMSDLKKLKFKEFVWQVNTENHPRHYFYFLIIANSERKSQIFVLNHSQYQFMERLKKQDGMLNPRYFYNGCNGKNGLGDFMMWLIEMGVISNKQSRYQNLHNTYY